MKALNLIPHAYLVRRSRRRRLRAWGAGLALYALAAVGGTFVGTLVSAGPYAASAEMVAQADAQLSELKRSIARASREATEWSRRAEAERAIGEHPRWSVLLSLLAKSRGDDIVLTQVDLQGPVKGAVGERGRGYRLAMEGVGRSQPSVTRYVLDLERAGVFDRVSVAEIRATEYRGESAAAFRLECVLGLNAPVGGGKP
jgi:Tfp pilus assembly protein PilN